MPAPRQRILGRRSVRNRSGSQRGEAVIARQREWSVATPARRWPVVICVAIPTLFLIGLSARTVGRHESPPEPDRRVFEQASLSSDAVNAAANQLFMSVKQWAREDCEDCDVPRFARERIAWLIAQQRMGALSIMLLKNTVNSNLDFEDLMAGGTVEGRHVIVIAQPRFAAFLTEGGRVAAPFSRQQRNDFMLGLVHETVHLQRPDPGNPARLEDRVNEEVRTWREVDVNVVRQLRQARQPMNEIFIIADEAIRSCRDREPCQPLRDLLLGGERRRQ
jgi:hypothetical protein